jgi:hypothetical protein
MAYISEQQIQYFLKDLDRGERLIQSRIARDARDDDECLPGYTNCQECGDPLWRSGSPQNLCAQCAGSASY